MNKFDRDIATLRDLLEQRQARGLRVEDLETEEERRAYRFWRTRCAQYDSGMMPDEPPPYEWFLQKVRESE